MRPAAAGRQGTRASPSADGPRPTVTSADPAPTSPREPPEGRTRGSPRSRCVAPHGSSMRAPTVKPMMPIPTCVSARDPACSARPRPPQGHASRRSGAAPSGKTPAARALRSAGGAGAPGSPRAAQLLEAGEGSVSEIAYAVSFKSVAHCSNRFQDHFGVRPSGYRLQPARL
jgi:hypothetical protein